MGVIAWLDKPAAGEASTGGKGGSLIQLRRHGFNVPPGFVITAAAYQSFLDHNALQPAIDAVLAVPDLRLPKVAREACASLSARLEVATLPDDVCHSAAESYERLRAGGVDVVAARSSALSEDGASASSAGLYESYLNLRDQPALLDAVLRCYRSLWSQRAVQYRAFKGLGGAGEAMAVVVMAMVPAEVAGVAFTANPVTGDRGQILINASWGLGESIVSGRVTPDCFVIAKDTGGVIEQQIADKQIEIVADPAGESGTIERPLTPDRTSAASLSPAALAELATISLAIESCYGRPMDIEWAYAGDVLYVLQARPITGLS